MLQYDFMVGVWFTGAITFRVPMFHEAILICEIVGILYTFFRVALCYVIWNKTDFFFFFNVFIITFTKILIP